MSKKYLTGSKLLEIIQRWINGIDDPEYDVLQTRKKGKYIVKPRKTTTTKDSNEETIESIEPAPEQDEPEQDEPIEGLCTIVDRGIRDAPGQNLRPKITPRPKQISRPKSKQ